MDEKQAIQLLWDEWKYRHDLFWKMLFRWAGLIIMLWIIPFLKPDVFKPWPSIALLFPGMAAILSLISAWVLGAEHRRFVAVNNKYDELRQQFLPPRMPKDTWLDRVYASPIGAWIVPVYGIASFILSLFVFLLLLAS